jgi:TIR domain
MKVFISWSGAQSHQVAVALRDWLPSVLQSVEPYVSSEDIDKGARWSTDISQELEDSSFGIICVTPENIDAPWVNFEAGALSKSLDRSRVAPFLFAVDRTAVQGPLLQFQSTLIEENDIKKLLHSMDRACGEHALGEARVSETFEVWWPHLESRLDELQSATPKTKAPNRPTADVLAEILELARGQQKLLASPEQLIPPAYIEWVLSMARDAERGTERIDLSILTDVVDAWKQLDREFAESRLDIPETLVEAYFGMEKAMGPLIHSMSPRRRRRGPAIRLETDEVMDRGSA